MAETEGVPDFSKGYKKWPVVLDRGASSAQRREEYEERGGLVIEGLIDAAHCDRLKARCAALVAVLALL